MKNYLKKSSLSLTVVFLLIVSCSKEESSEDNLENQIATYTLVSNETLPGEVVEIKSNKPLTESEINVMIDSKPVKAYANGADSYIFLMPVVMPGNYTLKLPVIDNKITLKLKVNNYVAITNPEVVINEFVVNREKCFDAIKQTGTSLETLMLIEQIKEEWDFQYSKNTIEDKLLLAYIVQKSAVNADWFSTSSKYPDNYYSKSKAFNLDAGEKLVTTAKEFVTAQTICLASIPALVGTGTLFLSAPNFITGAIFVATFTVFVVSREVAIRKAKEVGSLKGVAEAVSDVSYQKIAALELLQDKDTDISMKINFRNLKTTDINIQTDITKAFNEEKKFTVEDGRVKTLYDKTIKFTEKLKGLYVNHISLIGETSERNMTLTVLDKDIIVQGSSNADVKISTSLNADVRKIKATSTSTKDINFNLKIAYNRAIDGKEIMKEIPSVYKAKMSLTGTWVMESWNGHSVGVLFPVANSTSCPSLVDLYQSFNNVTFTFGQAGTYNGSKTETLIGNSINPSTCTITKSNQQTNTCTQQGTYSWDGNTINFIDGVFSCLNSPHSWSSPLVFITSDKIKFDNGIYNRQ